MQTFNSVIRSEDHLTLENMEVHDIYIYMRKKERGQFSIHMIVYKYVRMYLFVCIHESTQV